MTEVAERIGHSASLERTSWLVLLLWSNPNAPPNRRVHHKVFKSNVLNDTITVISRVWFNVDAFDWFMHGDISEEHVLDAGMVCAWWN